MDQKEKDRIAAEIAAEYRQTLRETTAAQVRDQRARHKPVAFKSMGTTYLLWFFLGGFGAHRFYLGYAVSGAGMFLVSVFCILIAWLPFVSVLTLPILGMLAIWWLIDALLIPRMMPESPAF